MDLRLRRPPQADGPRDWPGHQAGSLFSNQPLMAFAIAKTRDEKNQGVFARGEAPKKSLKSEGTEEIRKIAMKIAVSVGA